MAPFDFGGDLMVSNGTSTVAGDSDAATSHGEPLTTPAAARRRRASRWDDVPILDARGKPKTAVLTKRDFETIIKPLARYRYLPADYLHALTGGSLDYLVSRLALLSRQPNCFLQRPPQQRANASANCRRLIYELTGRGICVLQEHGLTVQRQRSPANFAHELMTCELMASVELGTIVAGIRLIGWQDILQSANMPNSTRALAKPYAIPVTVTHDGKVHAANVVADGEPFGIARPQEHGSVYFFCPGIEADCGTEPVDASDFERSSLYRKFVLYLAIEQQQIYRSHFGFPNLYVPFITANTARQASMMKLLERITSGIGSKNILFKIFPVFTSFEKPRAPSGHMLTEDWQRVGHPPFNFLTS